MPLLSWLLILAVGLAPPCVCWLIT